MTRGPEPPRRPNLSKPGSAAGIFGAPAVVASPFAPLDQPKLLAAPRPQSPAPARSNSGSNESPLLPMKAPIDVSTSLTRMSSPDGPAHDLEFHNGPNLGHVASNRQPAEDGTFFAFQRAELERLFDDWIEQLGRARTRHLKELEQLFAERRSAGSGPGASKALDVMAKPASSKGSKSCDHFQAQRSTESRPFAKFQSPMRDAVAPLDLQPSNVEEEEAFFHPFSVGWGNGITLRAAATSEESFQRVTSCDDESKLASEYKAKPGNQDIIVMQSVSSHGGEVGVFCAGRAMAETGWDIPKPIPSEPSLRASPSLFGHHLSLEAAQAAAQSVGKINDWLTDEIEEITSTPEAHVPKPTRLQECLRRAVGSRLFKIITCSAILANAVVVGIVTETSIEAIWSGEDLPDEFLYEVEMGFCGFFILEIILRVAARGSDFIFGKDWKWNLFDVLLVLHSVVDAFTRGYESNSVLWVLFRMLRCSPALRIIHVARIFHSFRSVVHTILGTLVNLLWVTVLLVTVMYLFALSFLHGVSRHLDINRGIYSDAQIAVIKHYYGSVLETVLTLFVCITGGDDWAIRMQPLRDIHWLYMAAFIFYVIFMVFGVMNVVVATFVDAAYKVSQRDRETVVAGEIDQMNAYSNKIRNFFREADTDMSGKLSWEEFETYLQDDNVKAYFNTMDLDVSQAKALFELLDMDHTNEVSIDEFIGGCLRMKGTARSLDVNLLLYDMERMMRRLSELQESVDGQYSSLERRLGLPAEKAVIENGSAPMARRVSTPKTERTREQHRRQAYRSLVLHQSEPALASVGKGIISAVKRSTADLKSLKSASSSFSASSYVSRFRA